MKLSEAHTEFLHTHFENNGKLSVEWKFSSWRKSFVHMYKGNLEKSLPVTVRIIVWKENFQKNGLYGQYQDILVPGSTNWLIEQSLPECNQFMVEVGFGSGEDFFPVLQSDCERFYGKQMTCHPEKGEWTPFSLDDKAWHSQVSTYTYYENTGGK